MFEASGLSLASVLVEGDTFGAFECVMRPCEGVAEGEWEYLLDGVTAKSDPIATTGANAKAVEHLGGVDTVADEGCFHISCG